MGANGIKYLQNLNQNLNKLCTSQMEASTPAPRAIWTFED